jgi:hypothetical protein
MTAVVVWILFVGTFFGVGLMRYRRAVREEQEWEEAQRVGHVLFDAGANPVTPGSHRWVK